MKAFSRYVLNKLIPSDAWNGASVEQTYDEYFLWQYKSSSRIFDCYPGFDVRGKSVLEIGCGTGGRSSFLASLGANRVVGIDINAEEIELARKLSQQHYPHLSDRLEFAVSVENGRLDIGDFDYCVLVDCLEHVVSPPAMMRLAHGYLKEGGKCYASCYGFYHHRGSHTGLLPFINVFFSDETILNVIRDRISRSDYVPCRFDSSPPIERWRGIYDLRDRPGEHLNKLRVSDMEKLVKYSIFRCARMTVVGFGNHRLLLKSVDWLRHIPIYREVYHSYVVLDFER